MTLGILTSLGPVTTQGFLITLGPVTNLGILKTVGLVTTLAILVTLGLDMNDPWPNQTPTARAVVRIDIYVHAQHISDERKVCSAPCSPANKDIFFKF